MSVCRLSEKSDVYCWVGGSGWNIAFNYKLGRKDELHKTEFSVYRRFKQLKKEGVKFPNTVYENILCNY